VRRNPFFTHYVRPNGFFYVLLAWIGTKMAISFSNEFPRLALLCKWDGEWYASIARLGYITTIPPTFQEPEISNVGFFPAYPMLARGLARLIGIPIEDALPLLSIACAILVSFSLHSILKNEKQVSRFVRYLILVAYPATFYLFVSYSESLYLAAMLGGISLLLDEERLKNITPLLMVIVSGFILGATRLTGFVIPSFIFAGAFLFSKRAKITGPTALHLFFSVTGILSFFIFCAVKFGHWNLYFQQLAIGWYKEFSPLKALNLLLTLPEGPWTTQGLITNSRTLSWIVVTSILLLCSYASIRAVITARFSYLTRNRGEFLRCFLVFGAFAHFLIVICGDTGPWDHWGNGLRYSLPTVFLLAVAWRDEWTPKFIRSSAVGRRAALVLLALILGYLFSIQVEYLDRFIRNEWVS
jgi:hypothetical protein